MENRLSIVEEIANAFNTHCASVVGLQQVFFGRNDDEIFDFQQNCPQDIADRIAEIGFEIPQASQDGTIPTETPNETKAWSLLETFGLKK